MPFHMNANCPLCEQGLLLFRKSSTGKLLFVTCDECDSVWLDVVGIKLENAFFPWHENGQWFIQGTEDSVFGGNSRWATLEEVNLRGWSDAISGECK